MNTSRKALVVAIAATLGAAQHAHAQVTAAKPSAYTLDTGETHFPDHLWPLNEGSGTTVEDEGDHTDHDLTLSGTTGGGPDWVTHGTHGDALDFVAANEDSALYSSVSSVSGTQVFCLVAVGTAGSGARTPASLSDPSQADRFVALVYQGDENLETLSRYDNTTQTNGSSLGMTGSQADLACMRFSDTTIDTSLNGSNWDTMAVTHTGLLASITRVALGARSVSTPSAFYDDQIIAAWWYHGDKDDAAIAAIYNSGNPWPVIGLDANVAPTFSAGPAAGTPTTTTIPTTFTFTQTGTVEGVACPDGGGTPSVTEVLADQCAGGGAAAAHWDEAVVGGVPDGESFTGLSPNSTYDLHFAGTGTGGNTAAVSSVNNVTTASAGAPAFDVDLAVSSQTSTSWTLSYDANAAAANIFVGAYVKDSPTPTCNNIEAGTGTGFVDNDTEAATGSSDSIVLTITGGDPFPLYDLYGCLEDAGGTTDSLVSDLLDEFLDAPAGRQYVVKSGAPGVGELGLLDGASPAAVDGDVLDVSELTDSFLQGDGAHVLNVNQDTTFDVNAEQDASGNPVAPDLSRQLLTRRFYDVSLGAWSDGTRILYCINNKLPEYQGPAEWEGDVPYLFEKGAAVSYFLDGVWSDPEDDPLSHNVLNMPAGGSEDGEELGGAFTTFGYFPTVTLEVTDLCGDEESEVVQFVVGFRIPDFNAGLYDDERLWAVASYFVANGGQRIPLPEAYVR